jgi:uncharacterized membrane protein (Fun14 family)
MFKSNKKRRSNRKNKRGVGKKAAIGGVVGGSIGYAIKKVLDKNHQ